MVNKLTTQAAGLPTCPKCKAERNKLCRTRLGYTAKRIHQARWRLHFSAPKEFVDLWWCTNCEEFVGDRSRHWCAWTNVLRIPKEAIARIQRGY